MAAGEKVGAAAVAQDHWQAGWEEDSMEKAAPGESTKLTVAYGEGLGELERDIQRAIAYRAYELYSARGRTHGRDLEDWFQAESDLAKPTDVRITDAGRQWIVQARTPGFRAAEIRVGASPRKVVIWGQGAHLTSTSARYSKQLLGEIELPSPANPAQSTAAVAGDSLEVRLPKEEPAASDGQGEK